MLVTGRAGTSIVIVVANTRDPYEILECLLDRAPREGRLCISALFTGIPQTRAFAWNGESFGNATLALSSLHGFVTIGYLLGKLHVAIDGTTRAVEMAGRGRLPDGDYFVALVAAGGPPAIKAIPCWSTADRERKLSARPVTSCTALIERKCKVAVLAREDAGHD